MELQSTSSFQALKYGYHQAKMTILVFWTYYATAAVQPNLSFIILNLQNLNHLIAISDLVIGMRLHSDPAAGLGGPVIQSTILKFVDLWRRSVKPNIRSP